MAKLTDARVATLKGHFNTGDQPSESNFADLIQWIQEGIEEHDHAGTGDGDGINNLVGPVGIGVAPTYVLDVKGNVAGDYIVRFHNDGGAINRHGLVVQAGHTVPATVGQTNYFVALDGSGGGTGILKTVNGVFQLADTSDERCKTNIKDTALNGLDIINDLRVRDYNWKANPEGPVMTSFVAQEAQKVFPSMVGEGPDEMLMTSRAMLIPIIVKAIQELYALQGAK